MVTEIRLGDVVRLKKKHPCGSDQWEVVRLGADIGIRCQGCQHRVLMTRSVFERRIRAFVSRGPQPEIQHQFGKDSGEVKGPC